MSDCQHKNAYLDDFLGEWHCDDCGETLDGPPQPVPSGETDE